jgi:hypothetical protein
MFILQYLDEITCDLKVFFGIDDADAELSATEFFRIITRLPAYKGAVRLAIEAWMNEHSDELEQMQKEKAKPQATPIPAGLTREQLKANPHIGAAPGAGQGAPLFDMQTVSNA